MIGKNSNRFARLIRKKSGDPAFLDKIERFREEFGTIVFAHYSRHELTTIGQYAARYSMEANRTVRYLLGNNSPLFDLQKPISESLVLPLMGHGLKEICNHRELVNFRWENSESGSQ